MSVSPSQNLYNDMARSMKAAYDLPTEEKLFRKALGNVASREELSPSTTRLLNQFQASSKQDDVLRVFDAIRSSNKVHKSKDSNITKLATRAASALLLYKEPITSITAVDSLVLSPVWGLLCAISTVLQNNFRSNALLTTATEKIESAKHVYSNLYNTSTPPSDQLQEALLAFNERVIEFCLHIGALLQKGVWGSSIRLAANELDQKTSVRFERIRQATKSVEDHIQIDIRNTVHNICRSQAYPPMAKAPLVSSRGPHARVIGMPSMLSRTFIARDRELAAIAICLEEYGGYGPARCVLTGIPGVGKSQTALKYADLHRVGTSDIAYNTIIFLRASSPAVILETFCNLGEGLGLCDGSLAPTDVSLVICRVKEWLQQNGRWLMIIDNVADSNHVLNYLPNEGEGHILFTTRSKTVADSLIPRDKVIELKPLDSATEGVQLVRSLSQRRQFSTSDDQATAYRIAIFARGLPLAIEQFVKFSELANLDWTEALQAVNDKAALLAQRNFCSSHEDNVSVGAIVLSTLGALERSNEQACALFRLLVHFDPSSIPLALLQNTNSKLNNYFGRLHTFERGAAHPMTPEIRALPVTEAENPYVRKMKNSLSRLGGRPVQSPRPSLPRVDSPEDLKLQKYWMSQVSSLGALFDDSMLLQNAITTLEDAGLLRQVRNLSALWIHDLFATVAQAIVERDFQHLQSVLPHMASLMVYLNFPTPGSYLTRELIIELLPHAFSVCGHLFEVGILRDCTVGPELNHLIASTIMYIHLGARTPEQCSHRNMEAGKFYELAIQGYIRSWQRLLAVPGVTWKQITEVTQAEVIWEVNAGFCTNTHLKDYDRVSSSAPWRCLATMNKLGNIFYQIGELSKAGFYADKAARMLEKLLGQDDSDTIAAYTQVMRIYQRRGDWQRAYEVALKRCTCVMNVQTTKPDMFSTSSEVLVPMNGGLRASENGAAAAKDVADCAVKIPGKEKEAVRWYEVAMEAQEHMYGLDSWFCNGCIQALARANEIVGDLQASMRWWAQSLGNALAGVEKQMLYDSDGEYCEPHMLNYEYADECVAHFKRMRSLTRGMLDPALEAYVFATEERIAIWEKLKILCAGTGEVVRQDIEAGDRIEEPLLTEPIAVQ